MDSFFRKCILFCKRAHIQALRFSMGFVFVWFGLLKCLDISPAHELVLNALPGSDTHLWVRMIGVWEVLIGSFLFSKKTLNLGLILFFLHVPGTFLPLFVSSQCCFISFPFNLTLQGQYIIKNLVLIAAAMTLAASLDISKKINRENP